MDIEERNRLREQSRHMTTEVIELKNGARRLLVNGAWSLAIPDDAEVEIYSAESWMRPILAMIKKSDIQFGVHLNPGQELLTFAEAKAVDDLSNQRVIDRDDLLVGIEYNDFFGIHDLIGRVRAPDFEPVDVNAAFSLKGSELGTVMALYKEILGSIRREGTSASIAGRSHVKERSKSDTRSISDSQDRKKSGESGRDQGADDESVYLTQDQLDGLDKIQADLRTMQSSLTSGMDVMSKYQQRQEDIKKQAEEKRKQATEGGKRRTPPKGDKAFSELFMIMKNEELLATLGIKHDDLYSLYEGDFPMYTKASFTKAIAELGPQMQSPEKRQTYEEAFRGVDMERRYQISTLSLFNLLEWPAFDCAARQAFEWTRHLYTSEEAEQVQLLLQSDIEQLKQDYLSAIEPLGNQFRIFSQAKAGLRVSIQNASMIAVIDENNIFQQRIGSDTAIVEMYSGEFFAATAKVPRAMAAAWGVHPDTIWKEAIQNKVNDQREEKSGDSHRIAEQARELAGRRYAAMKLPCEMAEDREDKKPSATSHKVVGNSSTIGKKSSTPSSKLNLNQSQSQQVAAIKKEIVELRAELSNITGWFKGRQRRELQEQIEEKQASLRQLEE